MDIVKQYMDKNKDQEDFEKEGQRIIWQVLYEWECDILQEDQMSMAFWDGTSIVLPFAIQ